MKYFLKIILLIIVLSLNLNAQEPKWLSKIKKITPIHSTEQDVEKLFGKPTERSINSVEYDLKDGYLSVEYATGSCDPLISFYLLPKGTVVNVDFSLKKDFQFNKLKIDLSKFETDKSDDTENISFRSSELGITYGTVLKYIENVDYDKRPLILQDVFYYPSEKYDHLECPRMK